jgi:Domain of unknown function (DUF1848)
LIVSASYRTDIPTFYGEWFRRRLDAGYCLVRNPYGGKPTRVSLLAADVDGFVFWTKNVGPFLPILDRVADLGLPFVLQSTINGYPRALESGVVDAARAVAQAHELAQLFGKRVVVWRYDTIVSSSLTPFLFHVENFARLAQGLRGATDEVVVSCAQLYQKTRRNLEKAARAHDFSFEDPPVTEKQALLDQLAAIAAAADMKMTLCAQPELLTSRLEGARCIDAERLAEIAGRPLAARQRGNRPGCLCAESRDIGAYDTCPHGCVYCYAVNDRHKAARRFERHDPDGEFLC